MADRPKPPPIDLVFPPCPICTADLEYEDGWHCPGCCASWPDQIDEVTEGKWANPEDEQCHATCQPLLHNRLVPKARRSVEYRCLRDRGHGGDHEHPNVIFCDEWRSDEPTPIDPADRAVADETRAL